VAGPVDAVITRVLLVRHGESTWNAERRVQGQLDPPLSQLGREQAEKLAARLASASISALYASDLSRASETARPLVPAVGCEIRFCPELREIALGEWEGKTAAELGREYPELWQGWLDEPDWALVPGGEPPEAFGARVDRAFEAVTAAHPGALIACVTHGGVIQALLRRVLGQSLHGLFPFRIDNGSITRLEKSAGGVTVAGVNDVCHLQ